MPISDIPILSMLRDRMEWHQERQRVLAENVANADTSNYQAKDLAPTDFSRELSAASVSLATTEPGHIGGGSNGGSQFATESSGRFEVRPRGNSVTHEDEMMKVASNQMDFDAVSDLYSRSLALIKLAVGKS
ncbi:MAG: flagellar basal body rod protein FlgB [Xanthobacteraceae bacterium]|jgi:flagellar basal-body rod protein FlgB